MLRNLTTEQLEELIGEKLRESRLDKNLTQHDLAARAGIHPSLVQRLEAGGGSSLKTFLAVVNALGHSDWLQAVAPVATNPFSQVEHRPRQRARKPRAPRG